MVAVRPWLHVGNYADTLDQARLKRRHIGAMLQLAEPVEQPGITSLYLAVEDGEPLPPGALEQGVAFVRAQKARGHAVLVACGAGISRSVTFALAVLKEEEELSLADAYRAIEAVHPKALPHPALWESLIEHYDEGISLAELWQQIRASS
jgi:hypothetical protein